MDQVRQYQILERIDSGAENIVYLGRDSRSDRNVAIRLVRLHDFVAPEAVDEFQRQLNADLRAARKLIHPAVVTDYELFEEFGLTWVVMELVDGVDLDELTRQPGSLRKKQALAILEQVADCLDHAHQMGVVHGDLRPRYVVVEPNDAVRVLSFGLRRIAELAALPQAQPTSHSVEQLSPEQWAGKAAGPAADQYGLASLAYRMLAGPLDSGATNGSRTRPRAVDRNPSLGEAASRALERALSARPSDRFPSCKDFVRRLTEALAQAPDWQLPSGAPEARAEPLKPPAPPQPVAPPDLEPEFEQVSEVPESTPSPLLTPFPSAYDPPPAPIAPLPELGVPETAVSPAPAPWPQDFVREGPIEYEGAAERRRGGLFGLSWSWIGIGLAAAMTIAIAIVYFWPGHDGEFTPRQTLVFREGQLPAPIVGQPFSYQFAMQGGTAPYRWRLQSGQLPPGLELDAQTGEIRGVPNAPGGYGFVVAAEDATGETAATEALLRTRAGVAIVTPPALPAGVLDVAYDYRLQALDGQEPYSWMVSDSILPPGLRLDTDSGVISGTPTAAGQFAFRVKVLDGTGKASEGDFSLPVGSGLTVTSSPALPRAVSGVDYTAELSAGGGLPPYQWSVVNGLLPSEYRLDSASGVISGRTGRAGVYQFTAEVKDGRGATASRAFSLNVGAALEVDSPSEVTEAVAGEPYQYYFASSGGVRPHRWRVAGGRLPGGLYLDEETGALRGTAEESGRYQFSVEVTDDGGARATAPVTLRVGEGLNIVSGAALPPAERDTGYAARLTAQGGQEPRVWTLLDGRLPPGINLAPGTGQLTGVPTAEGQYRFTVGVTDAGSESISREFTLQVTPRLAIEQAPVLPDAELNEPYQTVLSVTGGRPPFRWSVVSEGLPPGLRIIEESGRIEGTATRPGVFRFRVRALSAADTSATKEFALTVTEIGAGRLVWDGALPANRVLTIQEGRFASLGQLQGELPGVPVTISVEPPDLNLVTTPGPGNDWKLVVIHSGAVPRDHIVINWRIIR